jgi:hypothetical protein
MNLADQRCFNHALREAVARCSECRRFFCRECIAEYAGKMLCAGCLARTGQGPKHGNTKFGALSAMAQLTGVVIVLWLFFYAIGVGLLKLPTSFHEGTVWKQQLWNP